MEPMVATAAGLIVVALCLSWLSALALYLEWAPVLKVFPSGHQLVRAHVDYLIMAALLTMFVVLADRQGVVFPAWIQWASVVGAIWNPFGFVVLAATGKKRPDPGWMTTATFVGFVPVTVGFGGCALHLLANL